LGGLIWGPLHLVKFACLEDVHVPAVWGNGQ